MSGSNFTERDGKHPPSAAPGGKSPVLLGLKGICWFEVGVPLNAKVTAAESLETYIYIAAAMLVGKRMPTSPFPV